MWRTSTKDTKMCDRRPKRTPKCMTDVHKDTIFGVPVVWQTHTFTCIILIVIINIFSQKLDRLNKILSTLIIIKNIWTKWYISYLLKRLLHMEITLSCLLFFDIFSHVFNFLMRFMASTEHLHLYEEIGGGKIFNLKKKLLILVKN